MFGRLRQGLVLGGVLLLAGCGGRTEPQEKSAPTGSKRVTLHVKDMAERWTFFDWSDPTGFKKPCQGFQV